ncbi:MAG: peptide ABC transporter substrate-binding protein [Deltaproteobacteria bacterium]|nr:peptide ABC transporter substrate-binding protein [Deltaproteobacteria bacterium]
MRRVALAVLLLGAAVGTSPAALAKDFVYAESQAPAHMNPLLATYMNILRVDELLFDSLVRQGRNNKATEPGLAESWTVAPDQTSVSVRLRQGATWHDGEPVTADDVTFTVKAILDAGNASPDHDRLSVVREVVADDARSVTFRFTRPVREPLEKLTFKVVPAHLFGGKRVRADDPFGQKPQGTGPYRFVSRSAADNTIAMERVAGHPAGCSIERVVMKEVPDREAQKSTFKYGGIDAIVKVHHNDLKELSAIRHVNIVPYAQNSWWYMAFNLSRPHCRDPRFRAAVLTALNREKTMKAHLGRGKVISGPYAPTTAYYDHKIAPVAHDPDRASSMLAAAGYRNDGGTLSRDGRPVKLTLAVAPGVATFQEVVLDLQSQLKQVGIEVEVKSSFDARSWKRDVEEKRAYDLALGSWVFDEQASIYHLFHSQGRDNFVGYRNQVVDRYLDESLNTIDPVVAQNLGWKLHAVLAEDLPYAFLWSLEFSTAIWDRVQDVRIHPYYYFSFVCDWK